MKTQRFNHIPATRAHSEACLAAALDCNADLNRQFFAKSLELDRMRTDLADLVAAILAGRTNISVIDCVKEYHELRKALS